MLILLISLIHTKILHDKSELDSHCYIHFSLLGTLDKKNIKGSVAIKIGYMMTSYHDNEEEWRENVFLFC